MNVRADIKKRYTPSFKSRLSKTKKLVNSFANKGETILDLGPDNSLRLELIKEGYNIRGTGFVDLDDNYTTEPADIVTAFEIIEHLRNPYMVLKNINADKLILTVPLNVWFSGPYWNDKDEYDTHYHEFYPKQIYSLLDKTGWLVIHSEKWWWSELTFKPRPLLRKFGPWPSWIAIVAKRKK